VNLNLIKINKNKVEFVHIQIKGNSFERFGYFVNPKIRVWALERPAGIILSTSVKKIDINETGEIQKHRKK
jgi:hypothetical protein